MNLELLGFGPTGWGHIMLAAAGITLTVAACGMLLGAVIGALGAFAKLSDSRAARAAADAYTTILRGIPDLLVIYLLYFGSSAALSSIAHLFGASGFFGVPAFATGVVALGVVSGAYQTEVYRAAFLALNKGEIEAARSVGMPGFLMLRRIVAPQVLRFAIPGLGNVWQVILKESALLSVIGLTELLRQAQIGAGSTRQPFTFYLGAVALYLAITSVSSLLFEKAENRAMRGVRRS